MLFGDILIKKNFIQSTSTFSNKWVKYYKCIKDKHTI